jgi:purine-binding chemotaxis protein CheW
MEGICHMEHAVIEQELQLVTFRLANEEYGLPITKVREINRLVPVTKLPQTPSFMEGIINLRGRIIPVIDLRRRFEMSVGAHDEDTRIIIVEISGQIVGVIVDAVTEVVRLDTANIEPAPATVAVDLKYIEGVGKIDERLIILLDIDKVLTNQEELAVRHVSG